MHFFLCPMSDTSSFFLRVSMSFHYFRYCSRFGSMFLYTINYLQYFFGSCLLLQRYSANSIWSSSSPSSLSLMNLTWSVRVERNLPLFPSLPGFVRVPTLNLILCNLVYYLSNSLLSNTQSYKKSYYFC